MSRAKVQLHSNERGGFTLLVDGEDVSNVVSSLTLEVLHSNDAVLHLRIPVRELDVDLLQAEVIKD
jgi:hypothetical protein